MEDLTADIERNKELIKKYPFIKPDVENYAYSYTALDGIPEGWRKAFGEQMCEEIKAVVDRNGGVREGSHYEDGYYLTGLKEKWGMLNWYDNGNEEVEAILKKYERLSKETCIVCGKKATRRTIDYVNPFCDNCGPEEEEFERI